MTWIFFEFRAKPSAQQRRRIVPQSGGMEIAHDSQNKQSSGFNNVARTQKSPRVEDFAYRNSPAA